MILLDVNVLIAGAREDHPAHPEVRPWLVSALTGSRAIIVPDLVWVGFLRILTHPAILNPPSDLNEAAQFRDAVMGAASYSAVGQLPSWTTFDQVARDAAVSGSAATDAYLASYAISLGAAIATLDRGFRRYRDLEIVVPDRADLT